MIESARRRIPSDSTKKSPSHGFSCTEISPPRSRSSSSALGPASSDCASSKSICPRRATTEPTSAQRWFEYLSDTARYHGADLSPEMVRLARARLESHSPRAEVILTEGGPPIDEPTASYDRFVSNYVFDLLSHDDIRAVLREAHRILGPDGLLCLSGLSSGIGLTSRFVASVVGWIQSLRPSMVGGCRPLDLLPFLKESEWQVQHHSKVVAFGIPSEIVVAKRR